MGSVLDPSQILQKDARSERFINHNSTEREGPLIHFLATDPTELKTSPLAAQICRYQPKNLELKKRLFFYSPKRENWRLVQRGSVITISITNTQKKLIQRNSKHHHQHHKYAGIISQKTWNSKRLFFLFTKTRELIMTTGGSLPGKRKRGSSKTRRQKKTHTWSGLTYDYLRLYRVELR
jgi:hypothetical protein